MNLKEDTISNNLRIFIALELEAPIKDLLQSLADQLRTEIPRGSVRWVRSEGIHLTLKFIGDTSPDKLDVVKEAMHHVAEAGVQLCLCLRDLGCFPNFSRPKVIWAGVGGDIDGLQKLQSRVEASLMKIGFATEARPFRPHLTLGRVKSSDRTVQANIGDIVHNFRVAQTVTWNAYELSVMQSILYPTGAIYQTLAALPLGKIT